MSTSNTSFNIIIEDQITKLTNVQSAIKLLLESKHDTEIISRLKTKYEELQNFVNKLMKLKDALNYQVNLCGEIKNISVTLNLLVQKITNLNEDVSMKNDSRNLTPAPENNSNLQVSNSSSNNYYSPAECNIYNESEIRPIRPKALNMTFLEIDPLTQDEFSIVPKYMVGRITLDGINRFVELINKTLQVKYNLLSKPKSSLKGPDLQMYRDYKTQETEDIKGKYFVTELDIAKQQNKKNLEKSSYNLLVILRHSKRLYEERSARLLKFVVN